MSRELVFSTGEEGFGRQRLINGGFDWFQHGGSIAVPITIAGTGAYETADRWQMGFVAGGDITSQSTEGSAAVPPTNLSQRSLLFRSTHTGAGGDLRFRQFIESRNSFDLTAKSVSFGIWLFSDSADTVTLKLQEPMSKDTFTGISDIFSQDFSIVNDGTWQFFKLENILMPAIVAVGLGIRVEFKNFLNQSGTRLHRVAEAMVNEGSVILPFHRFASDNNQYTELEICKLSYEKSYDPDIVPGTANTDGSAAFQQNAPNQLDNLSTNQEFSITKRIIPTTVDMYDDAGTIGVVTTTVGNGQPRLGPTRIGRRGFVGGASSVGSKRAFFFQWTAFSEIT